MAATSYGVHELDGLLDDLTEVNLDRWVRKLAGIDRRLRALGPRDPEEAADRDALAATVAEDLFIEEVERPWRRNPFRAASAIPEAILGLISLDFAPLEERLSNVALRLEATPRFLAQAKGLLDEPCPAIWRRFAIAEQAQARKLREVHCFETTPAEFVAIGEAQIGEVSAKLSEQAASLGADDWAAKLDELRGSHPSRADLLPTYRKEVERLEAFVFEHDLATHPDSPTVINATPEF